MSIGIVIGVGFVRGSPVTGDAIRDETTLEIIHDETTGSPIRDETG